MPIIPIDELSNEFNMKDIFIDAKLTATSSLSKGNGTTRDFLGKKTFSTTFYRDNIGFGIVDINIEVNTSLQPIVEITFKDLYGNLMFGNNTDPELDYSVLFDWPPPKFIFSFKGYLGRPVQWFLSLKKTSTSYGETDGSYEIKASFVPNQWGFFADIPFVYLLAVKSLRAKEKGLVVNTVTNTANGTSGQVQIGSIFDLIKIGKTVSVKTQEKSKEFDVILRQVGLLKNGRILESISNDKLLDFDKPITGKVNNIQINGFNNITINRPEGLTYINEAAIKNFINSSTTEELTKANQYLLYISKVGVEPAVKLSYELFKELSNDAISAVINPKIQLLDDNISKIDLSIKQSIYSSNKDLLGLTTIGEVMRSLAGDTAYVLKRILQAGYEGYENNSSTRDSDKDDLIGKYYPLTIVGEEEVPATVGNIEKNARAQGVNTPTVVSRYGVEDYEMKFVREFIAALAEGISRDVEVGSESNIGNLDGDLKKRINNLEILRPNPYKPYYSSISENVMIRSGIVAFLTRNEDPNQPGGYGSTWYTPGDTYDSSETIIKMANFDSENITDSILQSLPDEDLQRLKKLANFFDKMFDDGGNIIKNDGNELSPIFLQASPTDPVSSAILDLKYTIEVGAGTTTETTTRDFLNTLFNGQLTNTAPVVSNEDIVDGALNHETGDPQVVPNNLQNSFIINPNYIPTPTVISDNPFVASYNGLISRFDNTNNAGGSVVQGNPMSFIDTNTYTAIKLINNGLPYFNAENNGSDVLFVIMRGQDALDSRIKNNSDFDNKWRTDETNNDPEKEGGLFGGTYIGGTKKTPYGFVVVDRFFQKDDNGLTTDPTNLIIAINDAIADGRVYDYDKMVNNLNLVSNVQFNISTGPQDYNWTLPLQDPDSILPTGYPAKDLAISVYAKHPSSVANTVIWWLFGNNRFSKYQRLYIKTMCKNILSKLRQIQENRSDLISQILGNTADIEGVIYKEFHNIFHQWDSVVGTNDKKGLEILDNYGNRDYHVQGIAGTSYADLTFIYDFPLANIKNISDINVRNSLISLEPLYKYDSRTTVLNMIQNLCSLNNFMFIPMPGFPGLQGQNDIYKPSPFTIPNSLQPLSFFYISFMPTLESRAKMTDEIKIGDKFSKPPNIKADALEVKFGSPSNHIIKSVHVTTEENKNTAESILNVQKLVDKDNQNKVVSTNCSTLPMIEGRSYKASFEMLGNAQVFPMQYFFVTNMPLFYGLYQIIKVRHSITPNNMNTSVEGIRMRFDVGTESFGAIRPITLESLASSNAFTVNGDVQDLTQISVSTSNGKMTQPNLATPTGAPTPAALSAANNVLNANSSVVNYNKLLTLTRARGAFVFLVYKWITELGWKVTITSASRSIDKQKQLYDDWVAKGSPPSLRPVNPANYGTAQVVHGDAIDVNLINEKGKAIKSNSSDLDWAPAVAIAKRYGFRWGGDFTNNKDRVHFDVRLGSYLIVSERIKKDPDWIRLGGELTFGKI